MSLKEKPEERNHEQDEDIYRNGVTCPHRVVNVEHVVPPGPCVGVGLHPGEVVVPVHGGEHRPVQLQRPEHGGGAWAALEPDHHRGALRRLQGGEEPEEHVAIVCRVHGQQARVALQRLSQSCRPQA